MLAAVALGLLVWALGVWALAGMGDEAAEVPSDQDRPVDARPVERMDLVRISDEYEWDIFDERLLVGYSDNVFAGRVLRKVGTEAAWTSIPDDDEDPHTQYTVRVLNVVKARGSAPVSSAQDIVVDQLGGPGEKTGKVHVAAPISCGQQVIDGPLRAGREYMFATNYDPDEDRYSISAPPAGAVEISEPGERATPEEREGYLATYRRAAEEQIDPLAPGTGPSCR